MEKIGLISSRRRAHDGNVNDPLPRFTAERRIAVPAAERQYRGCAMECDERLGERISKEKTCVKLRIIRISQKEKRKSQSVEEMEYGFPCRMRVVEKKEEAGNEGLHHV